MSLTDCLAITLFNAAVCISLPKVISLVQAFKVNRSNRLVDATQTTDVPEFTSQEAVAEPVRIS